MTLYGIIWDYSAEKNATFAKKRKLSSPLFRIRAQDNGKVIYLNCNV